MNVRVKIHNKLQFLKAIMDECGISLVQAKAIADKIFPIWYVNTAVFDINEFGWTKTTFVNICKRCGSSNIKYECG